MTRTRWIVFYISCVLLTGLWTAPACGQSGAHYTIKWAVVEDGSGLRRSATYRVSDSLEYVAGTNITSTSPQYINRPHAKARLAISDQLPAFAMPADVASDSDIPRASDAATVPEASTLALFSAGLLGLSVCARTLLKK